MAKRSKRTEVDDFLSSFIGSAPRARMLRVFLFNTQPFTLAQIAKRSGSSSRNAAKELKLLEKLKIIKKTKVIVEVPAQGDRVKKERIDAWTVNLDFRHSQALTKFVHNISPVHHQNLLLKLRRVGKLSAVILSGTFLGDSSRPADILVAGDNVSESRLQAAIKTIEPQVGRELRYAAFSTPEFRYRLTIQDRLIRDTLDYPHLVLLDKAQLL